MQRSFLELIVDLALAAEHVSELGIWPNESGLAVTRQVQTDRFKLIYTRGP